MAKKAPVRATRKQKAAAKIILENPGISTGAAMRQAGYSEAMAKNPQELTESRAWPELMNEFLSERDLAKAHKQLMNSHRLDHMVFPLGLEEEEIREMLAEVNCTARRFMWSDTQTHCWFWSPDNKARKDAIDMGYKLRGSYAPEKTLNVNVDVEPSDDIKALADKLNSA